MVPGCLIVSGRLFRLFFCLQKKTEVVGITPEQIPADSASLGSVLRQHSLEGEEDAVRVHVAAEAALGAELAREHDDKGLELAVRGALALRDRLVDREGDHSPDTVSYVIDSFECICT